jgi:putative CocE/NonD family hydrolase
VSPCVTGVKLLTDIYAPVGRSLGTLLIRTPYGRSIALLTARYYATQGYHVVHQSCRGTFGSGGDFQPFRPDIDDGADTVAWLRRQAWFGGRFALCGASYLGYTAWA